MTPSGKKYPAFSTYAGAENADKKSDSTPSPGPMSDDLRYWKKTASIARRQCLISCSCFCELLWRVVEAEGIEAARAEWRDVRRALAEAEVTRDVRIAFLDDFADAAALEERRKRKDLPISLRRDRTDGLERVHFREVDAKRLLAREVCDLGEDPPKCRELRDAAVHELGLAVPRECAETNGLVLLAEEPAAGRRRRKVKRVKADVARESAVERSRRVW